MLYDENRYITRGKFSESRFNRDCLAECSAQEGFMHRVHHSTVNRDTNSNFGFNLPWWDWLFRTYRPQPETGHEGMTIGIEQFREPSKLRLDRMLVQPFRDKGTTESLPDRTLPILRAPFSICPESLRLLY